MHTYTHAITARLISDGIITWELDEYTIAESNLLLNICAVTTDVSIGVMTLELQLVDGTALSKFQ